LVRERGSGEATKQKNNIQRASNKFILVSRMTVVADEMLGRASVFHPTIADADVKGRGEFLDAAEGGIPRRGRHRLACEKRGRGLAPSCLGQGNVRVAASSPRRKGEQARRYTERRVALKRTKRMSRAAGSEHVLRNSAVDMGRKLPGVHSRVRSLKSEAGEDAGHVSGPIEPPVGSLWPGLARFGPVGILTAPATNSGRSGSW
jgi:hypothetical protein